MEPNIVALQASLRELAASLNELKTQAAQLPRLPPKLLPELCSELWSADLMLRSAKESFAAQAPARPVRLTSHQRI